MRHPQFQRQDAPSAVVPLAAGAVAARNMAAIVATTAEPAPDPAPAQWRLESVDDPSAAIKLEICAGCTIGRVEVYNTSGEGEAPAEYINYMSREQVVLKLNQLMPDLLSCESKGLNPTGVQRCARELASSIKVAAHAASVRL